MYAPTPMPKHSPTPNAPRPARRPAVGPEYRLKHNRRRPGVPSESDSRKMPFARHRGYSLTAVSGKAERPGVGRHLWCVQRSMLGLLRDVLRTGRTKSGETLFGVARIYA